MFINLSNHPSEMWSAEQTEAAKRYGEIIDMPFPSVKPDGDEAYIDDLAEQYVKKVKEKGDPKDMVIHIMGEMNFTYAMVGRLQALGALCLASTTEHVSQVLSNGHRKSVFKFVRFRKYS